MTSGGSRPRSGRYAESNEWVFLPADGRKGPTPEFPLTDPSARETELWELLWRSSQATQWSGMELETASYVRCLARAEQPDSKAADWVLVRQSGDSLGLTKSGMLRMKWRIGAAEEGAGVDTPPARTSAKDRLRVLPGG